VLDTRRLLRGGGGKSRTIIVGRLLPVAGSERRVHHGAVVVIACLLAGGWLSLAALTGRGAHHRGRPFVPAVAAGLFFPFTWVFWYVADELPLARAPRQLH
jgi:hypothetical protein